MTACGLCQSTENFFSFDDSYVMLNVVKHLIKFAQDDILLYSFFIQFPLIFAGVLAVLKECGGIVMSA